MEEYFLAPVSEVEVFYDLLRELKLAETENDQHATLIARLLRVPEFDINEVFTRRGKRTTALHVA